jgi:ABC-type sugar transport system ATPase subunit
MVSTMTEPALRVEDISKSFPGVQALTDVSFDVLPGEVHALVGENGAGKSTLMRIIAGLEVADAGRVALSGATEDAEAPVGMVHQERSLVANLSVAENVFGGNAPAGRLGIVRRREMADRCREIFAQLQESVDPGARLDDLPPARQQLVEIAKALAARPRVLILDEPTAALTLGETDHLFAVLRRLRDSGVAIIYISHRLAEVFEIANRVTVLKDGLVTGRHPIEDVDEDRLIRLMVGRELSFARDGRRAAADAGVALEVRGLAAPPDVHDVSFAVRQGEIVCLAGLIGAGRTEACEAIFGARPMSAGEVLVEGRPRRIRHAADARRLGLGMVPEDRKDGGLFGEFSVLANVSSASLQALSRRGLVSRGRSRELAAEVVRRLDVATPSLDQPVDRLSGGNQQKVLIGRWLMTRPRVLIVDEPTRGVDVGARAQIYELLRELAEQGLALVVVSSDLSEVLTLAHRIVVFHEGRTVGELDGATADEEQILRLASLGEKEATPT